MNGIQPLQADQMEGGPGMIVFVPGLLENVADFARQIFLRAAEEHRWVLYLSPEGRQANPLAAARQLATLTALTQNEAVQASGMQASLENWTDALRELAHPGDVVVWPEERLRLPVSMEQALGITQQVLPASTVTAKSWLISALRSLVFWGSVLAMLAGFGYLKYRLSGMISGAPLYLVLLFVFTVEVTLLCQWSDAFS